MKNNNKIATYVGFSIKSRNCKMGVNAVATLKSAEILILCHTASENTKKEADKLARKFNCPIIEPTEKTLEQLAHRENAKVMAIADKSLSLAILSNSDEDFIARN